MLNNNSYKIYTAKDIAEYLAGEMPNHQRHAMEKAALDDPLLAEAIEGYESMNGADWNAALADLKSKITTAENVPVVSISKATSPLQWKAAAAVIVLLSGIGLTYLFTNREQPVILAEQHAEVKSVDSISGNAPAIVAAPVLPGNVAEAPSLVKAAPAKPGSMPIEDSIRISSELQNEAEGQDDFVYTPGRKVAEKPAPLPAYDKEDDKANTNPVSADNTINQSSIFSNQASTSNAVTEGYSKKTADNIYANDKFKTPANSGLNSFSGNVVAKDNSPVAFARINTNGKKQPVYTDKNGYFKISSPDTILSAEVQSAGYTAKNFTFKQGETNQTVVMEPVSIAEHKLTSPKPNAETAAAKMRREQKKEIEDQEEEATPVNGWEEYNNYLSNHGNIGDQTIHGVVEVFVNLDKNGSVSAIKVDKSLCAQCDAEAVRLVKEGPKWDVKTNKARKVKVKIRF